MNPLLPWAILGGILALSGTGATAYLVGRDHGRDACEAEQREAEEKAGEGIAQSNKSAADKEAVRKEIHREITREIPHVIQAPTYAVPCVDAAGAGLLDRAIAVANGEAGRREPDGPASILPPDSGDGPQR